MAESSNARAGRRMIPRVAATVLSGGILTVALLFASRSTAYAPADLSNLELGLPLAWITQDQSFFDPASFPHEASFVSPWEHPTMVEVPLMLVNVLVISAALWLLTLAWGRFSTRHREVPQ
ncbi:MAG: hypothetical protein QM628_13665 [Propionicimonas sp.]